jgi:hypothetical protein
MKLLPGPAWCLIVIVVLAISAAAQGDPQALVEKMVHNELATNNPNVYRMYIDKKREGKNTEVSRVIETPECWLTWPISSSGNATDAQVEKQRAQLNKLVNDPAACRKQRAGVNQDAGKADALLRMLPNAFLYSVEGRQDDKIHLKFRPNPAFHQPTREAKVFHNMQGTLVIDEKEEVRLVSIDGTLMSDVSFGFGVLAKLHKGGTFKVVQSEVAPHDWEVTLLEVHMNGRALFFKTISEQQHEVKSDFQRVPSGLSLAQAAAMVEKSNPSASASADISQ